jgi:hypothetical protein
LVVVVRCIKGSVPAYADPADLCLRFSEPPPTVTTVCRAVLIEMTPPDARM